MEGRISIIGWFLVITLVCIGTVEGFYQAFEYFVLGSPQITKKVEQETAAEQPSDTPEAPGEIQKPDYKIILERNLFGSYKQDTTPQTDDAAAETAAVPLSEIDIVLMGTVSGSENSRRAIIMNKKTREQEIYSAGEVIEGAMIEEIKRGEIILSIDGKQRSLDMSEAAEMRPAYKPSPEDGAVDPNAALMGTTPGTAVRTSPLPRRRVVRRPRATRPPRANTQ